MLAVLRQRVFDLLREGVRSVLEIFEDGDVIVEGWWGRCSGMVRTWFFGNAMGVDKCEQSPGVGDGPEVGQGHGGGGVSTGVVGLDVETLRRPGRVDLDGLISVHGVVGERRGRGEERHCVDGRGHVGRGTGHILDFVLLPG